MEDLLPDEIKNPKCLFVEGNQDRHFFIALLDKLGIRDYYVFGVTGKNRFNASLPLVPLIPGFDNVTHFAIIRDKDQDNAFASVVNILKKAGLNNVPEESGHFTQGSPRIGVFIMPGDIEGTTLEDLCLKTVEDRPAMRCVNEFYSCIAALNEPPRNAAKAKALAFLAAQPEIVNTIGLAAQRNYWNFDAPCLDPLKAFLKHLQY